MPTHKLGGIITINHYKLQLLMIGDIMFFHTYLNNIGIIVLLNCNLAKLYENLILLKDFLFGIFLLFNYYFMLYIIKKVPTSINYFGIP